MKTTTSVRAHARRTKGGMSPVRQHVRTVVRKGSIGNKKGWAFDVYFEDRPYPNVVSALYKTKKKTQQKAYEYVTSGKLDMYGDAE